MFKFLSKIYVKDYKNYKNGSVRLKLISLSGLVGVLINALLFIIKITIGLLSSSQAIIGDAFNNMSDSLTSFITLIGAKASNKPADSGHPYGHGRSEYIASFLVSIFIMFIGFVLFINSIKSFYKGDIPRLSFIALIILIFSLTFKIYIYLLNKKLNKMLDSQLNYAVMIDARNDILSTISIIISVIVQRYIDFNLDSIIGIILAVIVFKPGLDLSLETMDKLLGRGVSPELHKKIETIILEGDLIEGYHDLNIHEYGRGKLTGSCDVEVPSNISVGIMHQAVTDVEVRLKNELNISITIHMDPTYCLTENEENKKIIERLRKSVENGNKDIEDR
ncbi:cation diffusion facilitator family transporter [Anaerococcus porci]|uniref:cation diffusion facilitator family transporter n=1 Tax=Anaerococcus porci TaxID=2652269 RepID=UPI002A75E3E6|nr:cation diffusion facilitator family transporter [Anaerococcus porci]MDY3006986.1 cation diffusion facilitator family transporter [Anaerococcus porci]